MHYILTLFRGTSNGGLAITDIGTKCPDQTGHTWQYNEYTFKNAGEGLEVRCAAMSSTLEVGLHLDDAGNVVLYRNLESKTGVLWRPRMYQELHISNSVCAHSQALLSIFRIFQVAALNSR